MTENRKFNVKLFGILKQFTSQKSDKVLNPENPWIVTAATVEEFTLAMWQIVRSYLKREIYFVDDKPFWSDKLHADFEDLNRYLTIFDTKSRRSSYIATLTLSDLERWNDGRALTVSVVEHSTAVHSKSSWKAVEKNLLTIHKEPPPQPPVLAPPVTITTTPINGYEPIIKQGTFCNSL